MTKQAKEQRRTAAPKKKPTTNGTKKPTKAGWSLKRSQWNRRPTEERLAIIAETEAAMCRFAKALRGKQGWGWKHVTLIVSGPADDTPPFVMHFPTPRRRR